MPFLGVENPPSPSLLHEPLGAMKKAAWEGGFGGHAVLAYIRFQGHSPHLACDTVTFARRRMAVSS